MPHNSHNGAGGSNASATIPAVIATVPSGKASRATIGSKNAVHAAADSLLPRGLYHSSIRGRTGRINALDDETCVLLGNPSWSAISGGFGTARAAELARRAHDVDLLLSTDQGIRYQQNLAGRKIALVVLTGATKWSRVRLHMDRITAAVAAAKSGTYAEVEIPFN